jgi:hypothetical protein
MRHHGESVGVGADFGPAKPTRHGSKENLLLTQPLLGKEAVKNNNKIEISDLEVLLAEDELNVWADEGPELSRATSLSSLNSTQVTDQDWEETFRSMGPKFSHLADMAAGEDIDTCSDESSNESSDQSDTAGEEVDGSEV